MKYLCRRLVTFSSKTQTDCLRSVISNILLCSTKILLAAQLNIDYVRHNILSCNKQTE
uniref:Uncharacterized protein n=1 Tax=Anguilla anguilla TaxID=7936 RepID=A0A0E9RR52_ANGAN